MTAVRYFLTDNISLVYAETEEDYINFLTNLGRKLRKKIFLMNESIRNKRGNAYLQIATNLYTIGRARLSIIRNIFPTKEKIPAIYLHSGNWTENNYLVLGSRQNMIIATDDLGVLLNFLKLGKVISFSSFCKKSRLALRKIYM